MKFLIEVSSFICLLMGYVKGNIYASTSEMEDLVILERKLLNIAKDYLQVESRKLDGLRQFYKTVEKSVRLSSGDPSKYVENPINSYLLLKRFTSGWKELGGRLNQTDNKLRDIDRVMHLNRDIIPKYEVDFLGAVGALFRLQDTFGYTAREISDGKLKGIRESPHQFSADDCLEIAVLAYQAKRLQLMNDWATEAYRIVFKLKNRERAGNVSIGDLLEYLSWGNYLSGDLENAIKYGKELLRVEPDNETVRRNLKYFNHKMKSKKVQISTEQWDYREDVKVTDDFWNSHYAKACRGELKVTVRNTSSRVCYYMIRQPKHVIQPIKTERLSDDPEILIFHDVISSREADIIKQISKPELQMAEVFASGSGRLTTAGYRISKSAWLFYHPKMNLTIVDMDKRAEELTGLTRNTAEELQIVNYGLGGQYEFHKDHGEPGSPLDRHRYGNRIATLLFYLTDVEAGGTTAFTKVGVYVKPVKGNAIFWYNLHKNGTGDWRTEHASCPVISGSKWVMNKWFHSYGNEFRYPCSLNRWK